MQKILLTLVIMSCFFMPSKAHAFELNGLNIFKNIFTTTSNATNKTVASTNTSLQSINSQILKTNNQVQNSFLQLVSLLSTQQEANSIQSKVNSIINNATKTEAEKSSLVAQIISSYASTIANNKADIISLIQNMSAEEQKKLNNILAAMVKNSTQYITLAKNYTQTSAQLSKVSSNVQNAATVAANAKQTADALKDNATAIAGLAKNITSLVNQAD